MKFLRPYLLNLIIIFISMLAVIAVVIGIRVSITMVQRHNQMLEKLPSEQNVAARTVSKPATVGSLKELTFYFNGESIDAAAYLTSKDEVYFPFDSVLSKLGTKFTCYSSDDIVESTINGKKLLMSLGKSAYKYNNQDVDILSVPVAAKNHIIVPSELMERIEGFKSDYVEDKGEVFLNYWPGFVNNHDKGIKIMAIDQKTPKILDMAGYPLGNLEKVLRSADKILVSPDNSKFIAVNKNEVFLGDGGTNGDLRRIPVSTAASWSADSEYLYWIDNAKKTSFVYDVENKKVEELGDYYFKAVTWGEKGLERYGGKMLYVYKQEPGFKRIVLTNASYDNKYIFIERKGKVVVKGQFEYSPNKTRVLYKNSDNQYYLSNLEGTGQLCLGRYDMARWVNNDKIYMSNGDKSLIYSRTERKKIQVKDQWYKVGQNEKGDVFFMHGDTLYCESDWVERKIMMITGGCDYLAALSKKGPYIIVSQKEDNILYLNNDTIRYLGRFSSLLESSKDGEINTDFENNILISPDKKTLAVFQKNNNLISLNVVNSDGTNLRNICLNYLLSDETDIYNITPLWLAKDQLLLCSDKKTWVIGLGRSVKIFEWDSKEDRQIQGILR